MDRSSPPFLKIDN